MKKIFITIITIAVLIALYLFFKPSPLPESSATIIATEEIKKVNEVPLNKEYENSEYKFKLKYPEIFTVTFISDDFGDTILFQGLASKAGVQIYISPFDEPASTITKERIEEDADLTILESQPLEVGSSGKGLAFISKDTDGKEMRQVWFAFKNNLYQITTYKELDATLQKMMGTWKFF